MRKKNVGIAIDRHLKVQGKRNASIASLDALDLVPKRDANRLYQLGSDIKPMLKPDAYELPPRGDPKSRAPLPQFKK
jgi:hypothetical protein